MASSRGFEKYSCEHTESFFPLQCFFFSSHCFSKRNIAILWCVQWIYLEAFRQICGRNTSIHMDYSSTYNLTFMEICRGFCPQGYTNIPGCDLKSSWVCGPSKHLHKLERYCDLSVCLLARAQLGPQRFVPAWTLTIFKCSCFPWPVHWQIHTYDEMFTT